MNLFIKNLFIRNWELKLFSLVIAFTLWIILIPDEKIFSQKPLTIPLEPYSIPAGVELVVRPPMTIEVEVRAPKRLIDQITPTNLVARLNLERATIYQEEYPLNKKMINIPPGAEVLIVNPNKVYLKLETTKAIMLDIEPNIIGELKEGFKIEKIEVEPQRVLVEGAESKIKETDKVRTIPVDISSITQTTEIEAELILPDPDLRLITSRRIMIKITIQEVVKEEAKEKKDEEKVIFLLES